jgi:iron complex outermembrane recepter protein
MTTKKYTIGRVMMKADFRTALLCATSVPLLWAGTAAAQTTAPPAPNRPANAPVQPPAAPAVDPNDPDADNTTVGESGDIIVTGFRGSLELAIATRRDNIALVDSIVAEDIGRFPTQNIAEALQRLPGVELIRNDEANEGNRIQLRGLGPEFTLTTFNGAPVRTTSGGNIGQSTRDFNYDIFSSDLFAQADVYKTPYSYLEEGGIAGVVNLRTPRPFDRGGSQRISYSLQGVYNDQAEKVLPRGSLTYSNTWGNFGIAIGVAASSNRTQRAGFESTGLFFSEQANIDFNPTATFNSNYNPGAPNTVLTRDQLRTPGTVTPPPGGTNGLDTFRLDFRSPLANLNGLTVQQLRNALVPRLLRVTGTENDRDRIGGRASLQYKTDTLDISLDGLFARLDDTFQRQILGFAPRGSVRYSLANGSPDIAPGNSTNIPAWVPLAPTIDANNILGGRFGNVSMQNAGVYRNARTEFYNLSLNTTWDVSEALQLVGQVGYTKSTAEAFAHTAIVNSLGELNTIDYNISDPFNPTLTVARDVSNPVLYQQLQLSGNYRNEIDTQRNARLMANYDYEWGDYTGTVHVGGSFVRSVKQASLFSYGNAINATNTANPLNNVVLPLSLGGLTYGASTPANRLAYVQQTVLKPVGLSNFGGTNSGPFPTNWLALNRDFLDNVLEADDAARNSTFQAPSFFRAQEDIAAAFVQVDFETGSDGNQLRGSFGMRYVDTSTDIDTLSVVAGTTRPINTRGGYQNWLPNASLVYNITNDVIVRALYSRTLTRSSINLIARPLNIPNTGQQFIQLGNPDLRPQIADSFDFIGEWYFGRGNLLSIGVFQKDISGRPVGRQVQIPFRDLGLDSSLFTSPINTGNGVNPDELFTVETSVNLENYRIRGLEIAYQQTFRFLPAPFDGLGAIGSFTYINTADLPWVATDGTRSNLRILPKFTASGTLYYERGPISLRTSFTHRTPNFAGNIFQNNGINTQIWNSARTYVDAAIGYRFRPWLEFRVDMQNLTNTRTFQFARQRDGLFGDENSRVDNAYEAGRTISFGIRGNF